jgi:hypothetical protein
METADDALPADASGMQSADDNRTVHTTNNPMIEAAWDGWIQDEIHTGKLHTRTATLAAPGYSMFDFIYSVMLALCVRTDAPVKNTYNGRWERPQELSIKKLNGLLKPRLGPYAPLSFVTPDPSNEERETDNKTRDKQHRDVIRSHAKSGILSHFLFPLGFKRFADSLHRGKTKTHTAPGETAESFTIGRLADEYDALFQTRGSDDLKTGAAKTALLDAMTTGDVYNGISLESILARIVTDDSTDATKNYDVKENTRMLMLAFLNHTIIPVCEQLCWGCAVDLPQWTDEALRTKQSTIRAWVVNHMNGMPTLIQRIGGAINSMHALFGQFDDAYSPIQNELTDSGAATTGHPRKSHVSHVHVPRYYAEHLYASDAAWGTLASMHRTNGTDDSTLDVCVFGSGALFLHKISLQTDDRHAWRKKYGTMHTTTSEDGVSGYTIALTDAPNALGKFTHDSDLDIMTENIDVFEKLVDATRDFVKSSLHAECSVKTTHNDAESVGDDQQKQEEPTNKLPNAMAHVSVVYDHTESKDGTSRDNACRIMDVVDQATPPTDKHVLVVTALINGTQTRIMGIHVATLDLMKRQYRNAINVFTSELGEGVGEKESAIIKRKIGKATRSFQEVAWVQWLTLFKDANGNPSGDTFESTTEMHALFDELSDYRKRTSQIKLGSLPWVQWQQRLKLMLGSAHVLNVLGDTQMKNFKDRMPEEYNEKQTQALAGALWTQWLTLFETAQTQVETTGLMMETFNKLDLVHKEMAVRRTDVEPLAVWTGHAKTNGILETLKADKLVKLRESMSDENAKKVDDFVDQTLHAERDAEVNRLKRNPLFEKSEHLVELEAQITRILTQKASEPFLEVDTSDSTAPWADIAASHAPKSKFTGPLTAGEWCNQAVMEHIAAGQASAGAAASRGGSDEAGASGESSLNDGLRTTLRDINWRNFARNVTLHSMTIWHQPNTQSPTQPDRYTRLTLVRGPDTASTHAYTSVVIAEAFGCVMTVALNNNNEEPDAQPNAVHIVAVPGVALVDDNINTVLLMCDVRRAVTGLHFELAGNTYTLFEGVGVNGRLTVTTDARTYLFERVDTDHTEESQSIARSPLVTEATFSAVAKTAVLSDAVSSMAEHDPETAWTTASQSKELAAGDKVRLILSVTPRYTDDKSIDFLAGMIQQYSNRNYPAEGKIEGWLDTDKGKRSLNAFFDRAVANNNTAVVLVLGKNKHIQARVNDMSLDASKTVRDLFTHAAITYEAGVVRLLIQNEHIDEWARAQVLAEILPNYVLWTVDTWSTDDAIRMECQMQIIDALVRETPGAKLKKRDVSTVGIVFSHECIRLASKALIRIPEEFCFVHVKQDLSLQYNPGLELPDAFCRLLVNRRLDMSNDSIKALPRNFWRIHVKKDLNLSNNLLDELPDNFQRIHVGGNLNISGNGMASGTNTIVFPHVKGRVFHIGRDIDKAVAR